MEIDNIMYYGKDPANSWQLRYIHGRGWILSTPSWETVLPGVKKRQTGMAVIQAHRNVRQPVELTLYVGGSSYVGTLAPGMKIRDLHAAFEGAWKA